jgi:hypothetical protein
VTQYTLGLTRLLGHGHAFSEVVPVASPAVNTGFTYTVSRYWEIIDSLSFKLVTDANAGNRQVLVVVQNGNGVQLGAFPPASVQAATLTVHYSFLANVSAFLATVAGNSVSPIYHGLLQPGFKIVMTMTGSHVGDQVSEIVLNQERFVTGEEGYLIGTVEETDPRLAAAVKVATLLA